MMGQFTKMENYIVKWDSSLKWKIRLYNGTVH